MDRDGSERVVGHRLLCRRAAPAQTQTASGSAQTRRHLEDPQR
jgi:hypothetical protein